MVNVQGSIFRAPSFRKILTETMVWSGSENHRQAELVRLVNLRVKKRCRYMLVFLATSELIPGSFLPGVLKYVKLCGTIDLLLEYSNMFQEIPAKFVQAHGDKFHVTNGFRGRSCQLITVMVKIRTKSHGQMRLSFLDGWEHFTFVNGFKKDDHLLFSLVAVSTFYVQVIDRSPNSSSKSLKPISSMIPPNTSHLGKSVELGTEETMAHADARHERMVCKTSTNYTSLDFSVQEERVVQEQDFPRETLSKSLERISSMIPPNTLHLGESAEIDTEEIMAHADHERHELMVCKLSTEYMSSDFSVQEEQVVQDFPAETETVENLGDTNMMKWMKRVERRIQHHQLPPYKVVQFKTQLARSAIQNFGSDLCAHLILPAEYGRRAWLTLPRLVSLRGPKGGLWPVQCVKYYFQSKSSVHFKAGWGAFVEENLLEVGDELGFALTAHAHFEVNIVKKAWSSKKNKGPAEDSCHPNSIDIIAIS